MSAWLWLLACRSPAPPEPVVSSDQLLSHLESLTRQAPTRDHVALALGVQLTPAESSDHTAVYRATAPHLPSVAVTEARGEGTAPPRVALTLSGACLPFDALKERFGFAHAVPPHPGAPAAAGERFVHQLQTGRLTVRYREGCLHEAIFESAPGSPADRP